MKLYFMKKNVIDDLKANMTTLHPNYYRYSTNDWILERYDYDPFEFFMEVPDFELSMLDNRSIGEIELDNCKILFEHLRKISESQASDERLWAGLCNGVFYKYVRERWKYQQLKLKKPDTDTSAVISRFFFSGGGRAGMFRNTLSKCWWVGKATYDGANPKHWEMLDIIGPEDFATKVSDIFYSNNFVANEDILRGICKGLEFYRKKGIKLNVMQNIRPTLQYLNAIGGSVLLDMYSDTDIAKEVIDSIERTRLGKESAFVEEDLQKDDVDNVIEKESVDDELTTEINVEYKKDDKGNVDKEILSAQDILGSPSIIMYGTVVDVLDVHSGKVMKLKLPEKEGDGILYPLQKELIGHSVGDSVSFLAKKYEVMKISWSE